VRPRLSLVDAVVGLEGKGPGTGGSPRELGFLMAGVDTVAMDVACCRIANIDTASVPLLEAARSRGLWSGRAADIDAQGVPVAELLVPDYELPSRESRLTGLGPSSLLMRSLRPVLTNGLSPLPSPQEAPCTRCGACERACPTGAMRVGRKGAAVEEGKCIRCYCCHELCPNAAIGLVYKGMGRVMHRLGLIG